MLRYPFIFILFLLAIPSFAQRPDSLLVTAQRDGWCIVHKVTPGETIFILARRYHVPPAIFTDVNHLNYQYGLKENSTVMIPLGAYNTQSTPPASKSEGRALIYKVRAADDISWISRQANVSQKTIIIWNHLSENQLKTGQVVFVGWVLFDATPINAGNSVNLSASGGNHTPSAAISLKKNDTPKYVLQAGPPIVKPVDQPIETDSVGVVPTGIEAIYLQQTSNGANLTTEKGTAAFFNLSSNTKGADIYAFHNKAAVGAIIRVKNMNNGKVIYVKVLGPVPATKQYFNCIIGLNNTAKDALGAKESKMFCELSYGY